MKFVLKKSNSIGSAGMHYVSIVGKNGERLFTSEIYTTRRSALEAIDIVKRGAQLAPVTDSARKPKPKRA